ncbi:uncharacterized protein N7483_012945 [Penicillium malachiteum]|uniref:uncharacterized protein n=1 Tax=Penicillium malachiteum TaxID=1324776 RepID=UPI002547C2B8|nr:uncharacterized protein N7483_012945 [Penicillium malachiteum]KAJ5715764.1 hypothetical protein N7483_012945 [Penicillium malachiteum]
MPIRRSHNKSRHGCNNCKRRRVKYFQCNEGRPTCINCDQRQEPCIYAETGPVAFMEQPKRRYQKKTSSSDEDQRSQRLGSESQYSTVTQKEGDRADDSSLTADTPSLNLIQAELMLQWIYHTHKIFARNEATRQVWEKHVTREALQAPFLMHGILALSALHLSHLREDGKHIMWLDAAIAHKSTALSMFTEQLSNISNSNAKAMMGFAGLAFAFSLASTLESAKDVSRLDALIDVFSMARGVETVMSADEAFIQASEFAPLFDMTSPEVIVPDDTIRALEDLRKLYDRYALQSDHNLEAYNSAICCFGRLVEFAYAEPTSMTLAGGWAIRAQADYVDALKRREPLSLVILAHYAVFLHLARGNWCIGSWGHEVLEEILANLDSDWLPHVSWASEKVLGIH